MSHSEDNLPELFSNKRTTLADIKAAGYYAYGSSGGGWWWNRTKLPDGTPTERIEHAFLPRWIHELLADTRRTAELNVKNEFRQLLGMPPIKPK